jgi:hypothetical protein
MAVKQAEEMSKHKMVTLFSSAKTPDSSSHSRSEEHLKSSDAPQSPRGRQIVQPMERNPATRILREFALVIAVLLVFASVISEDPGIDATWDIGTGLYFAISKYLLCICGLGTNFADACRDRSLLTYSLFR